MSAKASNADERVNYQIKTDEVLTSLRGTRPRLLLHVCCAVCASYVLEYLSPHFDITIFFYNPNIEPREEHGKRLAEVFKLVQALVLDKSVSVVAPEYDCDAFSAAVMGLEDSPEGGRRCDACFALRLGQAAEYASVNGFEYLCSTLTVSPHKNALSVNAAGQLAASSAGVTWLMSDFKKRGGFKRCGELCALHGIYRQSYCGCRYSYNYPCQEKDVGL